MFIVCWEAVQGTDNPLRKEIFACINSIQWLGCNLYTWPCASYTISFEYKKNWDLSTLV